MRSPDLLEKVQQKGSLRFGYCFFKVNEKSISIRIAPIIILKKGTKRTLNINLKTIIDFLI
jgi:hypothetical protein